MSETGLSKSTSLGSSAAVGALLAITWAHAVQPRRLPEHAPGSNERLPSPPAAACGRPSRHRVAPAPEVTRGGRGLLHQRGRLVPGMVLPCDVTSGHTLVPRGARALKVRHAPSLRALGAILREAQQSPGAQSFSLALVLCVRARAARFPSPALSRCPSHVAAQGGGGGEGGCIGEPLRSRREPSGRGYACAPHPSTG